MEMSVRSESQNSNSSPRAGHKSGGLGSTVKSLLAEQQQRLSVKHCADLELIDDLRSFVKTRCHIESQYGQQLAKLSASHLQKKYPQFSTESESDVKTLYTSWKLYLEEQEKTSKRRLAGFEQLTSIVDQLKTIRAHKLNVAKKNLDNHFKKMCEEVMVSVNEIEKTKKLYFDEEHYANQARDKEEKIKKRKYGILSKFTDMQSKKEKSSAQREASDIQSTQARNEYIMSLAAGNAHLEQYYSYDLPNLMQTVDDGTLEKCKDFMIKWLENEFSCAKQTFESVSLGVEQVQQTSAELTNQIYLNEPTCNCLRDKLVIEFEPCENDTICTVSCEHNAAFSLEHEVTKWMTCFSKETRNLIRIDQQLIKCYDLIEAGKKTVEVNGVGNVDIEQRVDELRQQKRKCQISKCKAEARLKALKEGGLSVECLELIEQNLSEEVENQMRQQQQQRQQEKQRLEVTGSDPNDVILSRTPSLRSTNISPDFGRISAMENKSTSEDGGDMNDTHEPLSSEGDLSEDHVQQYAWNDYDPTAAWESGAGPDLSSGMDSSMAEPSSAEPGTDQMYPQVDEQMLVGKRVRALYPYSAQNEDELDLVEYEELQVISADEKDWVTATNANGQSGYIPVAYVELIDANTTSMTVEVEWNSTYSVQVVEESLAEGPSQPSPGESAEQTKWTEPEEADDQEVPDMTTASSAVDFATDAEYAVALYDYVGTSKEEISFKEGDQIRIISKSDDGWWVGEKDGVTGHFPSMLVQHNDDDEDEQEDSEPLSAETVSEMENVNASSGPPTLPPVAPPPSFAPPKPACLTPHQVVIIQPTPEIEHKLFVNDANDLNELEEPDLPPPPSIDQDTESSEKKEETSDLPPPPKTDVESTVEINVFESGPQRTSFSSEEGEREEEREDDRESPVTHSNVASKQEEQTYDAETQKSESALGSMTEAQFETGFDAKFEANFETIDCESLPPPPPPVDETSAAESPVCNDEEDEEDEQLIVKKLKQLKDDNNNFTSSFDQPEPEVPVIVPVTQANFANFDTNFDAMDDLK